MKKIILKEGSHDDTWISIHVIAASFGNLECTILSKDWITKFSVGGKLKKSKQIITLMVLKIGNFWDVCLGWSTLDDLKKCKDHNFYYFYGVYYCGQ